jgi:molybdenum cofactor cytidylyltransferase
VRLSKALRVQQGLTVAFTGAGGKSTAMHRLAHELSEDAPVILSTTTKLLRQQTHLAHFHLIAHDAVDLKNLQANLESHRVVLVTAGEVQEEPKWSGLSPDMMERVRQITGNVGATLLVEADGARGRSLKAPAAHEPVIPPFTDLVVPIVGLDVIGEAIGEEYVHRPEIVSQLAGLPSGGVIEPEHVAQVLCHPLGGLKGVPDGAEVRVLLNKVETVERIAAGEDLASRILQTSRIRAVILSSLQAEQPVSRVFGRIAGIVLAAGGSERFGSLKQLLPWRGKPLAWYALHAALDAGLEPIVVVIGAEASRVQRALASEGVHFMENPAWADGQSTSMRAGLHVVQDSVEAAVLLLADMPMVSDDLLRALVKMHRETLASLVAPVAGGRRGNPVLFDRGTFHALRDVRGDQGGRGLFNRFSAAWVPWDERIFFDVDNDEDLQRLGNMP